MGKRRKIEESGQIVMFDLTPSSADIKAIVKDRMTYFDLRQRARETRRKAANARKAKWEGGKA